MVTFDSIPHEILLLILQSIDSVAQLGECRRVCKKWDDPAELSMFSKPVHLKNYNASSLCNHLAKKPSRAKLIKTLHINCYYIDDGSIAQLLRLVSSSVETIVSCREYDNDRILQIIHDVARRSQEAFPNVKSIPTASELNDAYRETLLLFKNSLETICIPLDETSEHFEIDELAELKNLSKLILNGYFEDLPHLDSILDKARHLKEIEFGNCDLDFAGDTWPMQATQPTQETFDWIKQSVKPNQNLTAVKLSKESACNASLMEYLVCKYPSIMHFEMQLTNPLQYERICGAISKIQNYTLKDRSNNELLIPCLKNLKGDKNIMQIIYAGEARKYLDEDDYYDYNDCDVDDASNNIVNESTFESRVTQDQQRITHTRINIYRNSHDQVQRLMKIVGLVTDLQVDFVQAYDDEDFANEDFGDVSRSLDLESEIFFTALNQARGLEKMKCIAHSISATRANVTQSAQRRQLSRLEIVSANVDPQTFCFLNDSFYAINDLAISNCYVDKDETKTISISMASTKVGTLLINTDKNADIGYNRFLKDCEEIKYYYKRMKKKPAINETHIMISLQGNKTAIFKILPNCSDVTPMSYADYSSRPDTATTYHISCKSLDQFELNQIPQDIEYIYSYYACVLSIHNALINKTINF
ncbi:hypothetical protein MBANPS3_006420 [Mucor bainieri]